ncbi:MAG: acyl-homoserine-lactone synthase [Pikeienuella sp.]|uniref:acyl-homoserine-lactone synthase n=1 Tax=Pikeienuella sp. TaxID=2831957 RepID=UPI00391D7E0D
MIRFVYRHELADMPEIANEMFQKRRELFRDRFGWRLNVNELGQERDEYDDLNPLYIIVTDDDGRHVASTRIMPTAGRTMIGEHFSDLTGGAPVSSPKIWEITRFFVSADCDRRAISAQLMYAGCNFAYMNGIAAYVGVIEARMAPAFTIAGARPEIIGRGESAESEIYACRWETNEQLLSRLAVRAGKAAPAEARAAAVDLVAA